MRFPTGMKFYSYATHALHRGSNQWLTDDVRSWPTSTAPGSNAPVRHWVVGYSNPILLYSNTILLYSNYIMFCSKLLLKHSSPRFDTVVLCTLTPFLRRSNIAGLALRDGNMAAATIVSAFHGPSPPGTLLCVARVPSYKLYIAFHNYKYLYIYIHLFM